MDDFISNYSNGEDENFQFQVVQPNFSRKFLYILLSSIGPLAVIVAGSITSNPYFYVGLILVMIGIYFIPKLWDSVSRKLIEKNTTHAVGSYAADIDSTDFSTSVVKNINKIIGLKFDAKVNYYVETEPENIDMNNIRKIILDRVFDIVGGSLAMIFILAFVFNLIFPIKSENDLWIFIFYLFLFISLSPILISWRIPVIWTLADSGIRSIDSHHNVRVIGDELQKGIFSKLSGFGGLILGYSFFLDIITVLVSEPTFFIYVLAALILCLYVIVAIFPGIIITLVYMKKYHEMNVNLCRNILKTALPSGMTIVKKYEKYYGVD